MIKRLLLVILSAPLCLFCSCSPVQPEFDNYSKANEIGKPAEITYKKITAEQAKVIIDGDEPYILLDVRTDEEYREKRINGAVLIPDYEIIERAETDLPDKESLILIYCRSGRRSAIVAMELIEMGYTNVLDFGGIIDWQYDTIS